MQHHAVLFNHFSKIPQCFVKLLLTRNPFGHVKLTTNFSGSFEQMTLPAHRGQLGGREKSGKPRPHLDTILIDADEGPDITHVSLYDGTVEGIALGRHRARSVQFHPEAGPGPHDAWPIIEGWIEELRYAQAA